MPTLRLVAGLALFGLLAGSVSAWLAVAWWAIAVLAWRVESRRPRVPLSAGQQRARAQLVAGRWTP